MGRARAAAHVQYLPFAADHQDPDRVVSMVRVAAAALDELGDLLDFVATTGIAPAIGQQLPMSDAPEGFRSMLDGETAGKIVFTR